jgi:MFS superfamily sulfate permease-like transporter
MFPMKSRIAHLLRYASQDTAAGFVVFLVALPLCLGIALASNAPLLSGIVSGIIAGLVVTWLSGSQLSVSGPAAGLTLVVMGAISKLGSFSAVLVAVFLAGLFQIILGLVRAGIVASFFPHSVIKGMLAAIGLIIILKQAPHAVGWDADFEGDESFIQIQDHENTFSEVLIAFERFEPGAIAISLAALFIMLLWNSRRFQERSFITKIPAALVGVVVGTLVNELLRMYVPAWHLSLGSGHLVALTQGDFQTLIADLATPDWTAITRSDTWTIACTLAIIASIESLLSVEATDKLDPNRRTSNSNRELIAQGTGNMLCGMFGGLPITSVIVRSSANVYAGGRTKLSSFVHGVLLFVAVISIPGLLNKIPLAALAVVLIQIGWKLVSFKVVRNVFNEGLEQSLPFVVTVMAIILTDLLSGVLIGLVVGIVIVVRMNHHSAISLVSEGKDFLVRFSKDVSFAQKASLKEMLAGIPRGSSVTIDGTGAQYIDHDIVEVVQDFCAGAELRDITVHLKHMRTKRLSMRGIKHGELQEPFAGQQGLGPREAKS